MNLLYHHRTQGKGVEAVHITSVVKELRKLGHDVEIMSPPGVNLENNNQINSVRNRGSIWRVLSRRCPEMIFEIFEIVYNIYAYRMIKKKLSMNNIDGIYERYYLFSLASYILSQKYRKKIIYEVNDSAFLPRVRPLFFKYIAKAIEMKVLSSATNIIVVSKVFKRKLIENGIPEDKILVLHNGIDPDLFNTTYPSLPVNICNKLSGKFIIGFTGLFVPWHGLYMLLSVFRRIIKKHKNMHLLLVGDGPIISDLKEKINVLNLKSNVTITGIVPHSDIPGYISMMNICVIVQHADYTSPVKLFEYMAMGKPIVAPDMENIQEIVTNAKNAFLFTPNDENELECKINMIIKNEDIRNAIGEEAQKKVMANYTWHKNACVIEGIFLHNNYTTAC